MASVGGEDEAAHKKRFCELVDLFISIPREERQQMFGKAEEKFVLQRRAMQIVDEMEAFDQLEMSSRTEVESQVGAPDQDDEPDQSWFHPGHHSPSSAEIRLLALLVVWHVESAELHLESWRAAVLEQHRAWRTLGDEWRHREIGLREGS